MKTAKYALICIAVLGIFTAGLGVAMAAKPPEPPGKDPCMHGNSQKPCRDDPQPDHGGDCTAHGKGGKNEDHCKDTTTTTTTTQPPTTTTQPPTTTTTTTTQTTTNPPPTTTTGTTTTGTTTTGTTTTTTTNTTPTTTQETTTTSTPPVVPPPNNKPPKSKPPKPKPPTSNHRKPPPLCPVGKPTNKPCSVQGSG